MKRRTAILLAILGGLLGLTAFWCHRELVSGRRTALAARDDLAACRHMAARIEAFGRRQTIAEEHERRSAEVVAPIEQAAKGAGIASDRLVRITPMPPRRLEDTVYKEKPTQVILKRVTLQQMVTLLHRLTETDQPLYPAAVRLAAPDREDTGPLWDAEVVLTYLIYEPVRLSQ